MTHYLRILENNKQIPDKVAVIDKQSLIEEIGNCKRRLRSLKHIKEYLEGKGGWVSLNYLDSLKIRYTVKKFVVVRG